jgi:hypothetical protein
MAEMRTFRSRRPGPPVPFRFTYEVPATEKWNAGTDDQPDWQWQKRDTDEWRTEERIFHAKTKIPGGLAMEVSQDQADPSGPARQSRAIRRLIRAAVVEWEPFVDLLDDERAVMDPGDLGEIVNFLLETGSARPTETP